MAGSTTWLDKIAQVVDAFLPSPTHAPTPIPASVLPDTLPQPELPSPNPEIGISGGTVVINGVVLPELVMHQLKRLGLPLHWYNHGELMEAVDACRVDCSLVDDDEGQNFHDRIQLSHMEVEARKERRAGPENCEVTGCSAAAVVETGGFAERVKLDRLRRLYGTLSVQDPIQAAAPAAG
jgi:hypothetical protein